MKGTEYSPLKIFHHQDRLLSMKNGEQPYPAQIHIDICSSCNHSCHFCSYRLPDYIQAELFTKGSDLLPFGENNPSRHIPYEKLQEIVRDCVSMGVRAVQVTGGGEPTVHPQHIQFFEDVLDAGLDLALVTNGTVFRRGITEILLRAKWVRFSIDAGSAETYGKIRSINPNQFDKLKRNISGLVRARKNSTEHSDLVIGVGFVVTKENWREVVKCTRIARNLGVDNIRISAMFQREFKSYFEEFYEEAAALCKEAKSHETADFHVFNNFGERIHDLEQQSPGYKFCGYQNVCTYIGGDQNVYRCCVTSFSEHGKIGSLEDQSFKQLWDSEEKKKRFDTFDARSCELCMFNNKNETILYAIDPQPRHVNYV